MFKATGVQRTDTTRALSARVWHRCPYVAWMHNFGGLVLGDEFGNYGGLEQAPYKIDETDSGTVSIPTDEVGGVMRLATSANDNHEIYVASSNDEGGFLKVVKDSLKPIWFEARVKVNEIVTGSVYVGLMNEGELAGDVMADTQTDSAILDTSAPDFIGFITAGDSTAAGLDAIYMDQATVGAHIIHKADAHTWVADEYVKLGVAFNGGNIIRFYINGAQVGTDLAVDAAEVPDGEELLFVAGDKANTGTDHQLDVDWWKAAYDVAGCVGKMDW